MGIHVEIYKSNGMDCTKGGESSYVKGFTITDIDGPFEPTREYPAAKIIKQKFSFGASLKLVPESKLDEPTMFGGNYAGTSDSRFGNKCREIMGEDLGNVYGLGPVKIHDRVE
jgi:hypothetical protein